MKSKIVLLLVAAFVLNLTASAQLKKRVAISRFEDRSGSGFSHLGSGVADMLATALVKSGKFAVIERQELDKIVEEQKLGESGLVTAQTAPKVGQLLGAELFVVGAVTECGTKESNIGGGISVFGGGLKTKKARTVVDIRLINTSTGEIIASEAEEGTESTTGVAVRYSDIDFNNQDSWDNTDIGKATREAVNKTVDLIAANMEKIPWSGKIIKVNTDGTVLMKPGSEGNVTPGMVFFVVRKGEEIKDPDTGLSMGAEESKVGKIKATDDMLNGKAMKATVLEGKDFQVGDIVRDKEK
jgi:curli biogenesis system outer membrane secretion channel CsgG